MLFKLSGSFFIEISEVKHPLAFKTAKNGYIKYIKSLQTWFYRNVYEIIDLIVIRRLYEHDEIYHYPKPYKNAT